MANLGHLYGGLSYAERARLIARCVRTGDFSTLDQVRYTVPQGEGEHFNRVMATVRRHTSYGHWIADSLRLQAERDEARLLLAVTNRARRQLAWLTTWHVWKLVGYPVTATEYAHVVEMDKARPEPLGAFALHLWEMTADEAEQAGRRPDLVDWLRSTEDTDDDAGEAQAAALIGAAIQRGALPTPTPSEEGLALPWGACRAWLMPGRTEHEPYGPEWHIPLVEALGGTWAKWEIHPDSEQEAVRARRDLLAATLASVAALDLAALPGSIHPPASLDDQAAQQAAIQAAWPWKDDVWRGRAASIAAQQAGNLAQWRAVLTVLEESRIEDFAGEDPIPEGLRAKLDAVEAAMDRVAAV